MIHFRSKPVVEHAEVPLADEGRLEEIVAHWKQRGTLPGAEEQSRAYVVSVSAERETVVRSARLAEIVALVGSQGSSVVGQESVMVAEPNPKTLLGRGLTEELAARARAASATMLVLDAELSPSQARNLEDSAGIAICDREAVILNVFLRHARTRRAKVQVEIAQLDYLRPRIRGLGLDMDQQTGGTTRARGPGETASELLARKLDRRLEELRKTLRRLTTSATTQRRSRSSTKRLVLVGYTNAGKTSLMNALTEAELSARDMPFETLDTTSRCLTRHGGDVVLSDTVGFIRNLPDRLLASFESTLSEITEASLLVIVVDASDPERRHKLETTTALLAKMGAAETSRFYVWNKLDRVARPADGTSVSGLTDGELTRWSGGHPWALLSAHDPVAVGALGERLLAIARGNDATATVFVPYEDVGILGLVYGECRVLESVAGEGGLSLRLSGAPSIVSRIQTHLDRSQP